MQAALVASIARALAKKVKTPPPPRRPVQAPKVRSGRDDRSGRRIPTLWLVVGGGVLAAAIAVAAIAATRGDDASVPNAGPVGEFCKTKTVKAASARHVPFGTNVKYNTTPPSNGAHGAVLGEAPAVWDFYTEPVDPLRIVHNLEHGGIGIWWGSEVPPATVERLRSFYAESPNAMVGSPFPRLGSRIALTAWTRDEKVKSGLGRVLTCTRFDEAALRRFREAYRGNGPEPVSPELNRPGT